LRESGREGSRPTIDLVDDVRIGRLLRALRRRRGLRQVDVAHAAGVSQSLISLIERGHLAKLSIESLRRVFAVVEGRFEGLISWRGGAIDRLLDERHATLVGVVARDLGAAGWDVRVEVTFNEYGDRGSIDLLALWPDGSPALVVEVKTELTAIDDTIRRLDVKERLAPKIVADRWGRRPRTVCRLLAVLDTPTNRRRVTAHSQVLGPAFPDRGTAVRRWLRKPDGRLAGLRFCSDSNGRGTRQRSARPLVPDVARSALGSTRVAS
jgi:DNA-binding XRE family transcriptional regulator